MTASSKTGIDSAVKEKINEISLLLVMTSEQDEIGINMLCELFDALEASAANDVSCERLVKGWQHVKSQKNTVTQAAFFAILQDLVKNAVIFCDDPQKITFNYELVGATTSEKSQKDPLAGVDCEFLSEFIETQRMQLEEFEAWLLACAPENTSGKEGQSSEQNQDVDALIKRYIHSLKGDAYSIGLEEIGSICHDVEDVLTSKAVSTVCAQLMLFKEWLAAYLDALIHRVRPAESGAVFIAKFKQGCVATPKLDIAANKPTPVPAAESHPTETYTLGGEMDIFQEFVAEAQEHLGNVESVILESEGAYSKDSIDTIFRGIHSLKGGSAYFSFKEVTETSHLLENLLDEVRNGKRELDETLTGLVLAYIDLQKNLLASAKIAVTKDGVITKSQASTEFLRSLNEYVSGHAKQVPPTKEVDLPKIEKTKQMSNNVEVITEIKEPALTKETASATKADPIEVKNFVKVDTLRLDHLIDSIGEMVIYSSMLIRRCRELLPSHEDVISVTHRVEKFTRDLQDVGMSMRLVPIKGLFQKMSRLVWDTSKKIKKEIVFSMDGEDTELDRNLIDKLADPLMHMVRNALDHGVESPDERDKLGKSRAGNVHLSASHSGGCILIKIQDDGRGLNPEKLLAKAREKGIIAEGQKLSEQETYQLIFAAGFSTAAVVTDISGRGVGMDVVRRNVESLRGSIHIESKVGQGTIFTIELPLTLAIVDGIEVTVGEEHLIIPSLSVVEFLKPTKEMLNEALDRGETFQFRGKYLPIFRVSDLYNIKPRYSNPLDAIFIVVENNEELVALMVDEIVGELSTVIKSLGAFFDEVKGVSGCAVMPNGDVALILDIRSLVQLARTDYKREYIDNANCSVSV